MQLTSQKTNLEKSPEEVFDFLAKVENYEQLMPENLQHFEKMDETAFRFQLKGMPEIQLNIKETTKPDQIVLGSVGDKLPFLLTVEITKATEKKSEVELFFEGDFNAMMGMMIKKPIQNFIDTLSGNLGSRLEG